MSLRGSRLIGCSFYKADMSGANLDGCDVHETVFDFANMSGASLLALKHGKTASFRGTVLAGADLSENTDLDLILATISPGAKLHDTDLAKVVLPVDVSGVSFVGSDLSGNQGFSTCAVTGADLSGAKLPPRLPMVSVHVRVNGSIVADLIGCVCV